MPDCDDPELFEQPIGTRDTPDGCNVIELNNLGAPVFRSFECQDFVRFADQVWALRAVITDPECPDPGSIWTECSFETPLCQPRQGVAASEVEGGFQVAIQSPSTADAGIMMAPAPEEEIAAAEEMGALSAPAPAPAPEEEISAGIESVVGVPQTDEETLPGIISTTPEEGLR